MYVNGIKINKEGGHRGRAHPQLDAWENPKTYVPANKPNNWCKASKVDANGEGRKAFAYFGNNRSLETCRSQRVGILENRHTVKNVTANTNLVQRGNRRKIHLTPLDNLSMHDSSEADVTSLNVTGNTKTVASVVEKRGDLLKKKDPNNCKLSYTKGSNGSWETTFGIIPSDIKSAAGQDPRLVITTTTGKSVPFNPQLRKPSPPATPKPKNTDMKNTIGKYPLTITSQPLKDKKASEKFTPTTGSKSTPLEIHWEELRLEKSDLEPINLVYDHNTQYREPLPPIRAPPAKRINEESFDFNDSLDGSSRIKSSVGGCRPHGGDMLLPIRAAPAKSTMEEKMLDTKKNHITSSVTRQWFPCGDTYPQKVETKLVPEQNYDLETFALLSMTKKTKKSNKPKIVSLGMGYMTYKEGEEPEIVSSCSSCGSFPFLDLSPRD